MIHEIKRHYPETLIPNARGLEFNPSTVWLSNPMWDDALKVLMHSIVDSLGLQRSYDVEYRLDKVILDDAGDCRGTTVLEHAGNRFASIEIQLPSIFKGGAHIVRHDGMESVFAMGADDSSCKHDTWYLARFADCEHEIQAITQGCRLVMVYSLIWKGAGPAPRAPAMAAVRQLVQTLRTSVGCAGLYLYGADPDELGRHGFSSMTENRDKQRLGLLQAASAHMAQGSEPDHLVLHLCTAICLNNYGEVEPAVMDLQRRIYCPDGSKPSPAARTILSAFRFPEDMIGVDADSEILEDCEDDDSLRSPQGIYLDVPWWRNPDPAWPHDKGYISQVSAVSM
jgi:hypothetical protein